MERICALKPHSDTGRCEEVKVKIEDDDNISSIPPEFNAKQDDNEPKSETIQFHYIENELKNDIQTQENTNYNVDTIKHLEVKREDPNDSTTSKFIKDNYGLAELKFEGQIVQQDEVQKFLFNNIQSGVDFNLKGAQHETELNISENLQFQYLENDIQSQENKNYHINIIEQMNMENPIDDSDNQTEIKMEFEEQIVQQDGVPEFRIDNSKPAENIFECELCEKSFRTHVYLKKHKKSMHSECRNFKCSICKRAFKKRCHLKRHIKLHTNDNPFPCDLCEKSFATSSCLVRHKLCHTEHRNYKCSMCEEAYKCIAYLKKHIKRVHTESRNFSCEKCESTFKTNSDLNNHGRVHTDERPFSCELCNKGFKRQSSLSKHFRTRLHKKHLQTDVLHYSEELLSKTTNS